MKIKYSTTLDFVLTCIAVAIIILISYYTPLNLLKFSTKDTVNILINLFGIVIGFIITAVTVLMIFDYRQSEILTKIKEAGLFNQIFERYVSTTIVFLISLIFYIFTTIFYDSILMSYSIELNTIILFSLIISLFRLSNSVSLLKKILDVINR